MHGTFLKINKNIFISLAYNCLPFRMLGFSLISNKIAADGRVPRTDPPGSKRLTSLQRLGVCSNVAFRWHLKVTLRLLSYLHKIYWGLVHGSYKPAHPLASQFFRNKFFFFILL
jgi:hypothetical protein